MKTQFISNVSHELRTPLHGILGVARLLHLEASDRAVTRRLELIESSGTHLLGLINDLLDISRIEAGQFAMRSERFELGAVVQNLADLYTVRAVDKGLDFTLTLQLDQPCWVTGDPARVRQVLHNLLGNAVKFTQQGSITLTLMRDADSGRLSAEVQDTGPGIEAVGPGACVRGLPPGGRRRVAALRGHRAGPDDRARHRPGDGRRHQHPQHGGRGHLRAVHRAAAGGAGAGGQRRAGPADVRRGAAPCRCRVLIAEDDDVNAVIATAYLEHMGVTAERVKDGRQAVRHALREIDRPDLVLMDCRMPTMDGMAATREIRTQERSLGLARVPVIALTATTSDVNRQLCLNAGMDDFMSKPYTQRGSAAGAAALGASARPSAVG